jgi:hypothetical protein
MAKASSRKNMRKNRNVSRKAGRKVARKPSRKVVRKPSRKGGRKVARKGGRTMNRRRCNWAGGAQVYVPAGVSDNSMQAASRLNLAQGGDYASLHKGQHGGFIAPVGTTGMLDDSLRAAARITPIDQSISAASGMQDGGARRKGGKKLNHRAIMTLLKKMNKKMTKKQRGGMPYALTQAQDYSSPGMLLSPAAERAALGSMNPEWRLATDPNSFAPKMY